MRAHMRCTAAAATIVIVSACRGGGSPPEAAPTVDTSPTADPAVAQLGSAAAFCNNKGVGNPRRMQPASRFITMEDEGATLVIGGGGPLATWQTGKCILRQLQAPRTTVDLVERTTAAMGRQSDQFGDYEASWSFGAAKGLAMTIEAAG